MTFPSRRDRGYRAELARALWWARAWSRSPRKYAQQKLWLNRVAHGERAWARLDTFTGGLLRWGGAP